MVVSVVAVLTRVRSVPTMVSLLPARSVGIGLALLAFIPSKWPWHFGALAAMTAVALAAEVQRLADEREQGPRTIRPIAALVLISLVALDAWTAPGISAIAIDLQRLDWRDGFNSNTWLIAWLLLLAVFLIGRLILRSWGRLSPVCSRPSRPGCSQASRSQQSVSPLLSTSSMRRGFHGILPENLEALAGGGSCGLADHLSRDSSLVARIADPRIRTLADPSVSLYFPCSSTPRIDGGLVELPDVIISQRNWELMSHDSPFTAAEDLYELRQAGQPHQGVEVHLVTPTIPGYARADAIAVTHDFSLHS